jgi:hypothetical protein
MSSLTYQDFINILFSKKDNIGGRISICQSIEITLTIMLLLSLIYNYKILAILLAQGINITLAYDRFQSK